MHTPKPDKTHTPKRNLQPSMQSEIWGHLTQFVPTRPVPMYGLARRCLFRTGHQISLDPLLRRWIVNFIEELGMLVSVFAPHREPESSVVSLNVEREACSCQDFRVSFGFSSIFPL